LTHDFSWPELEVGAICRVTTRGRVSGEPHTVEIWFALELGTIYLLSGGGTRSDWVRNLIAHPEVQVTHRDRSEIGQGRVVDDPVENHRARDLVYEKYASRYGGLDGWRDSALVVAIDLV
jgi:deazaflavin-dependent oxidoreductase (nitroreductase family)